ncbi:MAG: phosphocholine cytidylyltransferase family protein [Candidatus Omnitrophota bacterium]
MKAIILAAGVGRRLSPLTETTPKSLISVGGKTILSRMMEALISAGIKDICIVVGYLKEKVEEAAVDFEQIAQISFIVNPDYEKGSILSVWAAKSCINGDILLMDSDVLFERLILEKLIKSGNLNCFLIDKNFKDSGEEMKIAALDGRVVQVARRITERYDEIGEGVGFFKLSGKYVKEFLSAFSKVISGNKDCDYENALDYLVKSASVGFEDVTGMKWTEIDFKEDIEKAEQLGL